jgi:chromosome segregation ATPase
MIEIQLPDWWKLLLGVLTLGGSMFGWMKVRQGRLAERDREQAKLLAEDREDQRKETERLRTELSTLRHRLNNDEHVYGLQHELHTERMSRATAERDNLNLQMDAMRREHREEMREREERFEERLKERKDRESDLARQVRELTLKAQDLATQVAELTRRLKLYEPDNIKPHPTDRSIE